MTEPNYKPRPSTAPENVYRASNTQRSRVTNTFKGITNSPLDNELFNLRMDQRPKAIPIYDTIAEHEIELSKDKRKFFSPKQYQTIIANFDLSNLNATYDSTCRTYNYPTNDNRYCNNTFSKTGLEKVYKFHSGLLNMPRSANFDQSRLFIQIETTDINVANYAFNYMFAMLPDTALSTATRITYKADNLEYQLNGYCPLNEIKMSIRDIAGNIVFNDPKMEFVISGIGATTILSSFNHGLVNGMVIYLDQNNRKDIFGRTYIITVLSPDTIEIAVDTTGLNYLIGTTLKMVIDDYVFNYLLKIYSIREDESTSVPNIR